MEGIQALPCPLGWQDSITQWEGKVIKTLSCRTWNSERFGECWQALLSYSFSQNTHDGVKITISVILNTAAGVPGRPGSERNLYIKPQRAGQGSGSACFRIMLKISPGITQEDTYKKLTDRPGHRARSNPMEPLAQNMSPGS